MAQVFEVDREELISDVQRLCPDLEQPYRRSTFKIAPVKSYVGDMKTLGSNIFPGVMVQSFANHWGVVFDLTMYLLPSVQRHIA